MPLFNRPLFNTTARFGSIPKLLHWSIFILVIIQFGLMYAREFLGEDSPYNIQLILLHKSFGIIIFVCISLMIITHFIGQRPPYENNGNNDYYQNLLAKLVHFLLYACLFIMPIAGVFMTLLSGRPLSFFGYPIVPAHWMATNKPLAGMIDKAHVMSSYLVLALVGIHMVAALYHHFIRKDKVLIRMLPDLKSNPD